MAGNQSGSSPLLKLKKLLIILGQPLLHLIFLFLYAVAVTSAVALRSTVQSIKFILFGFSQANTKTQILLSLIRHWLKRKAGKLTITLQAPARQALFLLKPKIRRKPLPKKTAILLTTLAAATAVVSVAVSLLVKDLPNPNRLITRDQIVSTKIYDRNGRLLFKIFKNENRTLVDLENIPPHFIEATIAIEDKNFYRHAGYSYRGILRALRTTLLRGRTEGGSTITQQLVKNALLTREKTLKRKMKEILLAILVETRFSKDEILSMYFNEVAYGGAAYGTEEAAQMYFGKPAAQLSLAEAALIAGLPAAPTRYSPFGTHPELAKFRQHEVLRRMVEDGYLTAEQAEQTKAEKLTFAPQKTAIKAPHFVMYVKELLVEKFGEQLVEQGGLEVTTSLDLNIQNFAQKAVTEEVDRLTDINITNGASLVTIPATGEILAMVGSRNFFDFERDGQVNVTLRPRQPGSAIKPVNYTVALENGFTASTILSDTPITYRVPGQPPYSPRNYDGTFHGKLTLRDALANSYNVPAVKTLSVFGVDKMIEKGQLMGISTWNDRSRYGLSLTLGGGEVIMTDLALVYGVLANRGARVDLHPILQVSDYRGRLLYRYTCPPDGRPVKPMIAQAAAEEEASCNKRQVTSPEVTFILTNILSDNNARAPAFGRHSVLNIPPHEVAVKTGTTQNLRDNWTIGFTKNVLVATWVGNNDNTPMSYVASGITGASPIFNTIMSGLLANKPPHRFEPLETIMRVAICPTTGTLPCESCPGRFEYFVPGTEPTKACIPKRAGTEENRKDSTPEARKRQERRVVRHESFDTIVNEILFTRQEALSSEDPR
ncbi:transglycosylase domain-containing protein [Patescibacteria group bacterium]|nr:transglycosylase domain-containing protein [Patescibacteria group bacterium]